MVLNAVDTVAITDPCSNLGQMLAFELTRQGVPVHLIFNSKEKQANLARVYGENPLISQCYIDFSSAGTIKCFAKIGIVVFSTLDEESYKSGENRRLIMSMGDANLSKVICISEPKSSRGVSSSLRSQMQYHNEQLIKMLGLPTIIFRCNYFQEAFINAVLESDQISGPNIKGKIAAVSLPDVVDSVVAMVMEREMPHQKEYNISGPEPLTVPDMADILTKVFGRQITVLSEKDQTETVIFQRMADVGWSVEGFMAVVKAIDDGEYEISTHEVENILGRPATSFEQTAIWLRDQHAKRNQ